MNRRIRFALPFGLLALALAGLAAVATAAEPMWTLTTEADIEFQRVTPLGNLLVGTDDGLMGIDPATGTRQWMRDDVKKLKGCNYEEISNTPYGLLDLGEGVGGTQRRVEVIDLATGEKRWDSEALPMNSSQGLYQAPQKRMLVMFGTPKKGTKSVVVGVDTETGEMKWQQDAMFKKPLVLYEVKGSGKFFKRMTVDGGQGPVFDTDDTMILFVSADGPMKIDLATGNVIWVASDLKLKAVPAVRSGHAQMMIGAGTLFIPYGKELYGVDVASGAPKWKKPVKTKGIVTQMRMTDAGLLVRGIPGVGKKGKRDGKAFIDLLDPATGESKWKKPFKDLDDATSFVVEGDHLFIAADRELFKIQIADGSASSMGKFKFKGNEEPSSLQKMDEGFCLVSSQNVMLMDPAGGEKYHQFYSAPGASGWAKLATSAIVMAVNVGSAASAYSRAQYSGQSQTYYLMGNPTLSKRFKATQNAEMYSSILTNVEDGGRKGPGLVKLDKRTGTEAAKVRLGDKTPEYELDEIEGRLFFLSDKREITCYAF